ncbi:MAG: transcriptional repressor [Armatimonadetes bacterium]|nr:transcriptional repressor [Armatimonadota bacterium]
MMATVLQSTAPPKRTRNTVQRRAVLCAVRALGDSHPAAADVFAHLRETAPGLSLATVYRALDALVSQKEIGRDFVANIARYDVSATPHHHTVCRVCGSVSDLNAPLPAATVRRLQNAANGFQLDLDAVQFSGVCATCRAAI